MKIGLVIFGSWIATAVAAQVGTAPPSATLARPGQMQVSPTAHVDEDTVAVDPQFELLRREITALKHDQAAQGEEIAQLRHCVAELVAASGTYQTKDGKQLAGPMKLAEDDDGDGHQLTTAVGKFAPPPKHVDLGGCG